MAKYNIYRVKPGKVDGLKEKLNASGYREITTQIQGTYTLSSYFTVVPKPTDIWWLGQYANLFEGYATKKNTVYSGAILAQSEKQTYLVALGKTHFYAQEFIDYTFGLDVAERIGSDRGAKTKSSKHFAGQTSKALISFSGDSLLSFTPGEATDYVKLKARDPDVWGKSYIHFGTSVQFSSIECDPSELNILLANLDSCLDERPSFHLPTILPIKDELRINQLDAEVSDAIIDESTRLSLVDFELYGVDFIFSQQTHLKLELNGILGPDITELSGHNIKQFIDDHDIDLGTDLRNINAKVYVNENSKFTVPLINLLDYVGDAEYFLYRGKWYVFNESFLSSLLELIKTIRVVVMDMEFSTAEHRVWQQHHMQEKVNYRERYVIDKILGTNTSLKDVDRTLDYRQYNGKKAKIEVCDIYDPVNEELNVVKIGEAKDFGYAFDQAALTLSLTKANKYSLADGSMIVVKRLRLTLVSSNVTIPDSPADINSLSFQIKLGELMNLAKDKNIDLLVAFARYS